MSFETSAFLKYTGAINSNNNKPGPSFISDSKWKMNWWCDTSSYLNTNTYAEGVLNLQNTCNVFLSKFAYANFYHLLPVTLCLTFLWWNLKWWFGSWKWLACQKKVLGVGCEAFVVFLTSFCESFQVPAGNFYMSADQTERAENAVHLAFIIQSFRPWCT